MQQDTTSVYLSSKLPFPLKVAKLTVREGQDIAKHAQIFTYKYSDYEPVALSKEDDDEDDDEHASKRKMIKVEYVGTYECPFAGQIQQINLHPGDVIEDASAPVLEIVEPCSHSIQYGGLCALCGKQIDEEDYSGFKDKDRAPISMAHGTTNLKVSSKEAASIERSSTERLVEERKLSLVVDLDQTVIHATVDPTVGEWMSDPMNPNYKALKDVRSFSLEEPAIPPPGYTGPPLPTNTRWYYVKLRPGLHEFLEKASKKYEMHIYTMATRLYAQEIGKIIDPDGMYFGDRILSRDESGSLTQKSLKRLFPVDTSMVVVIDDRGDVWNWSPNLIKVVPYDFFVGIGDINSSFLPRQQSLMGPSKRRKSVDILEENLQKSRDGESKADDEENTPPNREALAAEARKVGDDSAILTDDDDSAVSVKDVKLEDFVVTDESTEKIQKVPRPKLELSAVDAVVVEKKPEQNSEENSDSSASPSPLSVSGDQNSVSSKASSPVDRMVEMSEGDDNTELLAMQASERSTVLEQQQHERPLAKMQQNLEKILEEEQETKSTSLKQAPVSGVEEKEPHSLLSDDDNELEMLGQALVRIHNEFFFEIEKRRDTNRIPDVKDIMTAMKRMVFKGYVFLLSGVLPLGTPLDSADIVVWAKSFGATFVPEYNTSVTHVICKNPGTFKVRLAKSVNADTKIVNPDWLFSCMSLWEKVPEEDYKVQVDGLLSKRQVENFLKYHNHVEPERDGTFDASNLDWNEIDEEMREFMGDEYDELEDGSDDERSPTQEATTSATGATAPESSTSQVSGLSDEEFEQDILDDLADLEEEGDEGASGEEAKEKTASPTESPTTAT